MPIDPDSLPAFVAGDGPAAARRLRGARERMKEQLADLQQQRTEIEGLLADAFARADANQSARDRVRALAADSTRRVSPDTITRSKTRIG